MGTQRARSQEEIENRRTEILAACQTMFQTREYDDITLKSIAEITSMSRTSMYSYYQTKEDLFLSLLDQEYQAWGMALKETFETEDTMTVEEFCRFFTDSLFSREILMKLLSVHLTAIEKNCSLEQLKEFKRNIRPVHQTLDQGIDKMFPLAPKASKQLFISQALAFVSGVYPFCHPTEKQLEAMTAVNGSVDIPDERELCYSGLVLMAVELK